MSSDVGWHIRDKLRPVQCASMVQYRFASTETIRLVRTESPGRSPRLSHSSWTLNIYIRAKIRGKTFPLQNMLGFCYTFSTWHHTKSFLHGAVPRSHRKPCYSVIYIRDLLVSNYPISVNAQITAKVISGQAKHSNIHQVTNKRVTLSPLRSA